MVENQKIYIVSARDADADDEGIYGIYDDYESAEQLVLDLKSLVCLEITVEIRNPAYKTGSGQLPYAVVLNKTGREAYKVFADVSALAFKMALAESSMVHYENSTGDTGRFFTHVFAFSVQDAIEKAVYRRDKLIGKGKW